MKRIIILLSLLAVFTGCVRESFPENAVIQSKIGSLIMTVNGEDYTATPVLDENKKLTDNFALPVKIPAAKAVIKALSLTKPSAKVDFNVGDEVEFVDDVFTFHYTDESESIDYTVTMSYNPPPFLYFVKSSDRDAERVRYYLDVNVNPRIVSGTYNNDYEGYVDLTKTNWDNICLVKEDQSAYFDVAEGFGSTQSYGELTLVEKTPQGDGHFPSDGPWGNWTTNGGNESIVSPGYWRVRFNTETMKLVMLETQWAIRGSAVSELTMLTYDADEQVWKATCNLSAGSFKFVTVPVGAEDPRLEYGAAAGSEDRAIEGGNDISVAAGEYEITLDLHAAPNYTYSVAKPAQKITAHFSANAPQTKSAMTDGGIVFTNNDLDNLSIYQVTVKGDSEIQKALEITSKEVSADGKTFSAEAQVSEAASYNFRASIGKAGGDDGILRVEADQRPLATSYDPASDVLVSGDVKVESVAKVELPFVRKVAIVKLAINGIGAGEKVASVEVASDKPIAGTYNMAKAEFAGAESTIKLSYDKVETDGSLNCWFIAIPSEANSLSVKVVTEKREYEGEVSTPVDFVEGALAECAVTVIGGGESSYPFLYFVKTSDRFVDNKKYTVDPDQSQKIVSGEMNSNYEGYIDLTGTSWDNIGLVKSDFSGWFDSTSGFSGGQSYGTLILDAETAEAGAVQFPCNGPWGDWTTTGGNDKIISPGYWKVNFNMETRELVMLETQWAISGSAVSEVTAMTYYPEEKVWKLNCTLSAGSVKFTTIPVSEGDPSVEYGEVASGKLGVGGSDITVSAGTYEIVLDLHNAPAYTFSMNAAQVKESFMYFVKTSDKFVDGKKYTVDPEQSQKIYADEVSGAFEGYIDLTGTSWDNIGLVKANMSKYYDSTSGFGAGQSYGTLTLVEETPEEGSVQFPCNGPWGDWTTNGGNDQIVSPGYWKVNFDPATLELVMLETQWAVSGSAVSEVTAMTYNAEEKVWKLTCALSNGAIKFATIPVSSGDPTVEYGEIATGKVGVGGGDISVSAGTYEITLDLHAGGQYAYSLKSTGPGPDPTPSEAFMYFVKTSDRYVDNKKYTIDPDQSQKVYSHDGNAFEGYIDLTGTSWDNIGLVKSDMSGYFDSSSGFGGGQSYGTLTLVEETPEEGSVQFPCNGPWGDWTTNGGNDKIISPGYWKVNFDMSTKELVMLETQWAIHGDAVADVTAMTYDSSARVWKLSCTLAAGTIKFVTIPVSEGDPTVEYGVVEGKLGAGGNAIAAEAGDYDIVLNLHASTGYTYSLTKK